MKDVALVGGKTASLGELYRELMFKGINVPMGLPSQRKLIGVFCVLPNIDQQIQEILSGLDTRETANLQERGSAVRHAIMAAPLPQDLQHSIIAAYRELSRGADKPMDVAVGSSATAEDLPDASFAGQQRLYHQAPVLAARNFVGAIYLSALLVFGVPYLLLSF